MDCIHGRSARALSVVVALTFLLAAGCVGQSGGGPKAASSSAPSTYRGQSSVFAPPTVNLPMGSALVIPGAKGAASKMAGTPAVQGGMTGARKAFADALTRAASATSAEEAQAMVPQLKLLASRIPVSRTSDLTNTDPLCVFMLNIVAIFPPFLQAILATIIRFVFTIVTCPIPSGV